MAIKIFRGDAQAVAQVDTATPGGTIEIGDIFILTINGKDVTFTATGTDVASTVAGLVAAWNASSEPEHAEITATDTTTEVTLTADTAGKPFTLTATTTEAGGGAADLQTHVQATITSSSGPNHWDTAENWSGATLPASGDDIYISDLDVDILYGLDQSAIDAFASVTIAQSYTGQIGLPRITSTGYLEYRERYLKLPANVAATDTTIAIGGGSGDGSSRIQLDAGAGRTSLTIHATGQAAEDDGHTIRFKGSHVSNTVSCISGSLDIALEGDETAVIATLKASGDAIVRSADGVTLTTVQIDGTAQADLESAITTLTSDGSARVTITGTGAIGTINSYGGQIDHRSSGTISTLNAEPGNHITFERNIEGCTVTDVVARDNTTILDPHAKITWTNAWTGNAKLGTVNWDLGRGVTYKFG